MPTASASQLAQLESLIDSARRAMRAVPEVAIPVLDYELRTEQDDPDRNRHIIGRGVELVRRGAATADPDRPGHLILAETRLWLMRNGTLLHQSRQGRSGPGSETWVAGCRHGGPTGGFSRAFSAEDVLAAYPMAEIAQGAYAVTMAAAEALDDTSQGHRLRARTIAQTYGLEGSKA